MTELTMRDTSLDQKQPLLVTVLKAALAIVALAVILTQAFVVMVVYYAIYVAVVTFSVRFSWSRWFGFYLELTDEQVAVAYVMALVALAAIMFVTWKSWTTWTKRLVDEVIDWIQGRTPEALQR